MEYRSIPYLNISIGNIGVKLSRLLFFIALFLFTGAHAQKSKIPSKNVLPDWRKYTFDYTKQVIPSKIKNDNTGELFPITLKRASIIKVDNEQVILAICALESGVKETASLTYFFIIPKTTQEGIIPPRRRTSVRDPRMSIEICCTEASEELLRGATRCALIRSSTQ